MCLLERQIGQEVLRSESDACRGQVSRSTYLKHSNGACPAAENLANKHTGKVDHAQNQHGEHSLRDGVLQRVVRSMSDRVGSTSGMEVRNDDP